ncbi:MAG: Na/Pi cotransporter family protein [Gammaproteobacteria bacterium]|nr:Na/Pi cotransporter family protein [Gammaproteobacteria bacterium]MBT3721819.1 Na/Pi cotransporter family protein [Gammaproteobacteria bacterium]MBT4078340.1 Na/Pi cotransporter family protein [Gammaproteobacteria bacterium]MBT4196099.1 Na/Pi cotransporter family protein [Gammaproteobacteria bacterium]MBT4451785.1 Na/Pi cotransporter family protein [Gammaproteobacteria bacterium]
MFKKILIPLLFLLFAWFIVTNTDAKTIIAGISIFLIGMHYMENGFKLFSGGTLEIVLEKFTSTTPKAIGTGFLATAIVQSSSLVSVIIISFLSAELIGLTQAVGVVFGSNIGTTTTAWLVSSLGLKIKIAHYALPMLIFGVVMQFSKHTSYKGLGSVLIGLGFIFLGIGYMKDGFETLKEGLDLAEYAMQGYLGVFVYILFGAVATVVIQSSSATMAIIITALATGQIDYINALSLAIGANVGTTVTAAMGALASNKNGKRLAVAHFIFNIITGIIAVAFIYQLKDLVDWLAPQFSISDTNYAMKLALFHTIFNVIGVLAVSPFINPLVRYLKTLFHIDVAARGKAKYLTDEVMELPSTALAALRKETIHLYDKSLEAIVHAMNLHRSEIFSDTEISKVVKHSNAQIKIDIDKIYQQDIKNLYSQILHYASLSQSYMDQADNNKIYELKLTARNIIEMVKDVRELQKNLNFYAKSNNNFTIDKYNEIRAQLITVLRKIQRIRDYVVDETAEVDIQTQIELQKEKAKVNESEEKLNQNIASLIRENKINSTMASSLINDVGFSHSICRKFLNSATTLWVKEDEMKELGDEYEY